MIEYLSQALSSLSTALTIGKSLIVTRDSAKPQEAIIQFNINIIDAQSKIMASQDEQTALTIKIGELEKECMRLKNWETERKKYSRKEISPGVFAYMENNFIGNFQNAHKYCCNCFDKTIPSTLQQSTIRREKGIGRMKILTCPNGCPDLEFRNYIDQN